MVRLGLYSQIRLSPIQELSKLLNSHPLSLIVKTLALKSKSITHSVYGMPMKAEAVGGVAKVNRWGHGVNQTSDIDLVQKDHKIIQGFCCLVL